MKKLNKKIVATLVFSLAAILAPLLFLWGFIFSFANSMLVVLMYGLTAAAFLLLFMKPKKGNKGLFTIATVVMLVVPLVYAYLYVAPLLVGGMAMLYVLMQFVLASGVVTFYTQWAKIKSLF